MALCIFALLLHSLCEFLMFQCSLSFFGVTEAPLLVLVSSSICAEAHHRQVLRRNTAIHTVHQLVPRWTCLRHDSSKAFATYDMRLLRANSVQT